MEEDKDALEARFNALPAIERLTFAWHRWIWCVKTFARMKRDPFTTGVDLRKHFALCKEMRDYWREVVFYTSEEVMIENHNGAIVGTIKPKS